MRKLIFGINITLDGCCDHTKMIADEDVHEYFAHLLHDVDLLVYGRKTYELMVPFWPDIAKDHSATTKAMNDFAQAFDNVKGMVVCSRSLEKAEGKNTRIIRANLEEEILRLKREPGKNISTGGVDIPSQLIRSGLVDEYHFVVHPLVAGAGTRLMDETILPEKLQITLVESKIFKSGCVALRYVRNQ